MTQLANPLHSGTNSGQPVVFGSLVEYAAGTAGVPKIWRGRGVVGDYAGAEVILYDANQNILLGQKAMAGSIPVVLPSDGVLPARTRTADAIAVAMQTDAIMNGLTALTPKYAVIAASTSGNNTIVAAVATKKIRVLAYNMIAAGTVNAKFQTGAGGTDITGLKYLIANSGIAAPFNPAGWFETAAGVLLNLNLSAAIAVGGELVYVEV